MKNLFNATLILLVFLGFNTKSFAQNTKILIGTIMTEDGKKKDCDVEFIDGNGKKFVKKTDNGSFEQLLNVGEEYQVTFVADDILRDSDSFTLTPPDEEFTPEKKTFKVIKLAKGKTIKSFDLFKENSAEFNGSKNEIIKKIKILLRFNRSINVNLVCNGTKASDRAKALEAIVSKDKRLKRSANVTTGSGTNESTDLVIVVSELK